MQQRRIDDDDGRIRFAAMYGILVGGLAVRGSCVLRAWTRLRVQEREAKKRGRRKVAVL
jgi:hypothetical protein